MFSAWLLESFPAPVLSPAAVTERSIAVFDAQKPLCPGCGHVLRRLWVQDGIAFARCEERRTVRGHHLVCGQHSIISAGDGVAAVSPLTPAEFKVLRSHADRIRRMRQAVHQRLRESGQELESLGSGSGLTAAAAR